MKIWEELKWRGLIAQSTDEKVLSDLLNNKSIIVNNLEDYTKYTIKVNRIAKNRNQNKNNIR